MDISSMLEVQVNEVKETDFKENVTREDLLPSTTNVSLAISQDESNFYKLMFGNDISAVRFRRLHCTACDAHIGSAPADSHNMFEHPVLCTLLCAKCRDFYGDGTFEQGDDATDMFCRWCANGGNLYCCSFCSNTFCYKCIKRNFDPILRKKIEADEKWKCFVCDPTDLYTARATCWALRQHIQTVNRILQHNCKMTQDEIDEKMNLDETQCCPRRRKRKRRRTGSNSEEEDETYIPKVEGPAVVSKRKKRGRGKSKLPNGSNVPVFIRPYPGVSDETSGPYIDANELLPSLLSCEQTMVECEDATVNADGTIVSQYQANSSSEREKSLTARQQMYNKSVVNVVAAAGFLQSATPIVSLRHVTGPLSRMNLFQTVHCTSTPMVTIPNQSNNMLKRPRLALPEPQTSTTTMTPNVIEIESDSEDIAIVDPSHNARYFKNHVDSQKAVPVALVSSKSNYNNVKRQELSERRNARTLNQRLLPHGQEIDNILVSLKTKLQSLFEVSKREELKRYELNDARLMIKQFHREIRDTVSQLACINDRIVREYSRWKRYQFKVGVTQPGSDNNECNNVKNEEMSLDMTCVNESDSDDEDCSESNHSVISPSELIGMTNVVEGIQFFRKRNTVDRAVGDDSVSLMNKSVQIYDVELRDYDNCIGQSLLSTAIQQSGKHKDASNSSVKEVKTSSKSYEDQFIHYLQKRTEVQSIRGEESKDLPDPNETSLKDLIEANSPFISEMLETMDKSVASSNINNLSTSSTGESNSASTGHQETNLVKAVDALVKMVDNITDDLDINKKVLVNSSVCVKESHKNTELQTGHVATSDGIRVANILKNIKQDTSRTNSSTVGSESSNEDDCTIIDD